MWASWGPDWSNASTVIPELFTPNGGFDLSQVDDKAFNEKTAQAKASTDRQAQAELWKELNKEAMEQVWVVPTRFGRDQRLAGSKVGSASGKDGAASTCGRRSGRGRTATCSSARRQGSDPASTVVLARRSAPVRGRGVPPLPLRASPGAGRQRAAARRRRSVTSPFTTSRKEFSSPGSSPSRSTPGGPASSAPTVRGRRGAQHVLRGGGRAQQVRPAVLRVGQPLDQPRSHQLVDPVAQRRRRHAHDGLQVRRSHRLMPVQHHQRAALERRYTALLQLLVEQLADPGVGDGDVQREREGAARRDMAKMLRVDNASAPAGRRCPGRPRCTSSRGPGAHRGARAPAPRSAPAAHRSCRAGGPVRWRRRSG